MKRSIGRSGLALRAVGGDSRSGLRVIPRGVWAITGLWIALLLGASLIWPTFTGLDEPTHVDYAYTLSKNLTHIPAPGSLNDSNAVLRAQATFVLNPSTSRISGTNLPVRSKRPSLKSLDDGTRSPDQVDQMTQHPPLYYLIQAAMLRATGLTGHPVDVMVWFMRLLGIVLVLPVPLLAWASTRHLLLAGTDITSEAANRLAMIGAFLPMTAPAFIRICASVSNDGLLIVSSSAVTYGLIRILTGSAGWRVGVFTGTAMIVALWTKGFALALIPVLLLALACAVVRAKARRREVLIQVAVPVLVSIVIGATWWAHNVVAYGSLQPAGRPYAQGSTPSQFSHFLPNYLDQFATRIWDGLGVPDGPSLGLASYFFLGWALLLLAGALAVNWRQWSYLIDLGMVLLMPISGLAIAGLGAWQLDETHHLGVIAAQGRYIYHGFTAMAAVVTVGIVGVIQRRLYKAVIMLVFVSIALMNVTAWTLILRSWYAADRRMNPIRQTLAGAGSMVTSSPLPTVITVTLTVVLPLAAIVGGYLVIRRDVRGLPSVYSSS